MNLNTYVADGMAI